MNTKKVICLGFALFMAATGVFAQKGILTIEDALKISKLKNMKEATSVLKKYGYSEAMYEGYPYYSNDVVSYWYKNCEISCGPVNSFNINKVDNKSASAVSVLADVYDRALKLVVCNKNVKDDCLKQMKKLGFKRVKKGENGTEFYAKAKDTIIVSTEEGVSYTWVNVVLGERFSFRVPKVLLNENEMENGLLRDGFKRIKKDVYVYEDEKDTVQILIDKTWDGTTFEFEFRLTNWEFTEEAYRRFSEDDEILVHELDVSEAELVDVSDYWEEDEAEEIVKVPDVMPEFPGGMEALLKYLGENIKYPELTRTNGISGKVYVTFVIEKDGSISNVRILRDIGGGCGVEAVRVVKSMPKWTPGKINGRIVRCEFNLPVNFQFNEAPKE